LGAVRFLDESIKVQLLTSIIKRIDSMYPLVPQIASLIKEVVRSSHPDNAECIFAEVRALFQKSHFVTKVPVNLLFLLRALAYDRAVETDVILVQTYQISPSPSIKRECIFAAARRRSTAWLKRIKLSYNTLTPAEKRAFLCASYFMGDEGDYWRDRVRPTLDDFDKLLCEWIEHKRKENSNWELPL
jgi:hypothetical protein